MVHNVETKYNSSHIKGKIGHVKYVKYIIVHMTKLKYTIVNLKRLNKPTNTNTYRTITIVKIKYNIIHKVMELDKEKTIFIYCK